MSHHSRFARTVGAVTLLIAVLLATSGGAGALVGPPPTPVPPHGSLSPFPSVLNTPSDQTTAPVLTAPVAILADLKSGQILFAKSPDTPRPIASLTKVMTALLTLERASPDDVVTISPDAVYAKKDYGYSSTLGLVAGERLSVRDLLYAMLLNSANDAAVALAIDVGGSYGDFVRMMNRKAHTLGMDHTAFYSPNGLDDRGHSTGPDMVRLIRAAMSDPGFGAIVATKVRAIPAPSGPPRVIQNRNVMLWLYPGATGAKTGYTAAARYCLIATATRHGRSLVAIVLGAPVDAFSDGAALLNYGFDSFERHEFVVDGDEVGAVRIRGGTVPAIAADGIGGLVPSVEIPDARRAIHIDPRAAFPPAPGQRIGTLKITLPGLTVGVSRLIAGSLPPPGPESGAPWWAEAAAAVGHAVAQTVHGLLRT